MKKLFLAIAITALAALTPAAALAGEDGGHGSGHDMDMGGHGGGNRGSGHRNAPTSAGAREIAVTAGRFRYKPNEITLTAGEDVTIVMTSTDLFHDFFVKGEGGHIVGAKAKTTKKGGLSIDEPGTYKFWCTVEGHRAAGMKGTIVVQ